MIQRLMTMDPGDKVRVYTRQDRAAWQVALDLGYLSGSHSAPTDDCNGDFAYPYEWMRQQMSRRVQDFSGDLPVWAWLKRQNERKWVNSWDAKERLNLPIMPRITALVPRRRILLSCYDLWHFHLNNWYVPETGVDNEAYEARWPTYKLPGTDPIYQSETEVNWTKVFDIHLPRSTYYEKELVGRIGVVQACVDRIYLEEVVDVRWFVENPPQPASE